jgi:hypothetical protein
MVLAVSGPKVPKINAVAELRVDEGRDIPSQRPLTLSKIEPNIVKIFTSFVCNKGVFTCGNA